MTDVMTEVPVATRGPKCGVQTCEEWIYGDQIVCMGHWNKLPKEMQERLVEAFRPEKHERGLPNPSWDMASAQAINFLTIRK